jgi:cytochrome c peroxidase
MEKKEPLFIGGNFWDGRATGERLGNPAAEQALGPFLNPVEQAAPDMAWIVDKVCTGPYSGDFDLVWPGACGISASVASTYDKIGLTIAAYEASHESNSYTSKFDFIMKGMAKFTKKEKQGFHLFAGKGKCAKCHVLDAGPNGEPPLFTDFTYDNLGIPGNALNPVYNPTTTNRDPGLGGFLSTRPDYDDYAEANLGKHKVPTLRNVDKRPYEGFVKAFGHNGYFKSLKGIVHFYNTRDAKPACANPWATEIDAMAANCWPAPEIAENVNESELGNLHLTDAQENAIVEFLKTLSDGYEP